MKIDVLDHGYVELIEPTGTGRGGRRREAASENQPKDDYEVAIIEAARQSTQGAFRGWNQDARLLRRLWRGEAETEENKNHLPSMPVHATPFEFSGMTIEVQAPIMVFREWHRHRTQSYNEMSARYAPLPDLYYLPDQAATQQRVHAASTSNNKQESGSKPMSVSEASELTVGWLQSVERFYRHAELQYQDALAAGIPKELARAVMPVGHYSRMRAKANLRNWLGFITLRCDEAAQWEIRQFSNAVQQIMYQIFPRTMALWKEGQS